MTRLAVLLGLAAILVPVHAAEPGDEGPALVEHFIREVKTLSGRFEQSLIDADKALVEESSGTLEIRRPGQFRWAYVEPYEHLLVADGLNVWSYDVDLAQVTVEPQREVLDSTPALLLGGSPDALARFDYIGSFSDRGTVWVRYRPKDRDNGFSKVELGFTDGRLTRMLFADNLEQTTLIALFDVLLNGDIDADRFRFDPPEGVDVVGTPATADTGNSAADS